MSLLTGLVLVLAVTSLTSATGRPRGVPIERASLYEGNQEFKCLSNGHAIPMEHVNDDYCDCEDGSDEPGTSACPNALFYCENRPYKGSYIISSRVNDGICDCCDGSDEYDGTIKCDNTCEQMFAAIRAAQEQFLKKQEIGYKVKLDYIQQGKRTKDEKVARLSDLETTKEVFVKQRNEAEEKKNLAETPEKEAKDKHEAAWNAVLDERKKAKETDVASIAFAELDANSDGIVDFPEIQNHMEFDIDNDGTVSDEEAKEYLEEKEEMNLEDFTNQVWPNIKEIYKAPEGVEPLLEEEPGTPDVPEPAKMDDPVPPPTIPDDLDIAEGGDEREDDDEGYLDDRDDDHYDDEDEDEEDMEDAMERAERKLGRDVSTPATDEEEKMPDYDDEIKALISAADEARTQYNEADRKLKDFEKEITDINKYMELDMGPQEEFSALKDKCFEYTDREYTYKLCPFDKCSQRPKSGGIETSLGKWGHWYGPKEDKYSAMKYENGQGCWNGPARSCHVNMHCGEDNAVTSASEPSRCEYQFDFTTPSLCAEPQGQAATHSHTEL